MGLHLLKRILLSSLAATALSAAAGCGGATSGGATADPAAVRSMRAAFAAGAKKSGAAAVAEFKHDGGYASLAGRFRLAGAPPRRSPINDRINKDVEVCAPAGRTVLSERLIVDEATGGIANVVLYLKSEPGRNVPIHESAARPREGAPAVLDNKACLFVPHVLAVHRGIGALTIANSDQVAHNANVAAEKGTVENRQIAPGGRTTYELTAEESKPVAVTCTVHTWMKGYLLPRDNGYFAVTDREGRFEIPNLPAGDVLTILVWHEATGNRGTGDFLKDFKVASEAVKPAKQGFTVTLAKDKPLSLEFEVPAAAFPAP